VAIAQPGKDRIGLHVIPPRNWRTDMPRRRVCPQVIGFALSGQTRRFRRFVTNHPDSVHCPTVDTRLCAALPAERSDRTETFLR